MKKTLLVLSTILAMSMIFVGCQKDPETKGDDKSIPASAPDAGTTDPTPDAGEAAPAEDFVIFDEEQTFTTSAYNTKYDFAEEIDLSAYKYIKVEASSNDTAANKCVIQFMDSNVVCGLVESTEMTENKTVYYTNCGTNFWQDKDYDGTPETQCTTNSLKYIQFYAQDTVNWQTVDDIDITVYSITLTNNK